mmetsp:Transcript_325/g.692  ORF Transcript_325/g.692 Transcript_325/m.692 type:complete len:428 (+) Transcript_325:111-1394(+)|eukprot:CAMPEP_0206467620 /NCGR_PEP_ID=MMETSP0324_2-20121206/29142_1 /ASSEMBLY_ACC=CAM_ASM_000836 /TAXON_ID=2866 /ORGANISM="Crypthecodinium cohnii, Strain Seligo" /LENGTH=427 /DNA_ID=CAMNT_0053940921 /DNA_START=32 /DNA_END=1315 /DNA_ORIENTATION=+
MSNYDDMPGRDEIRREYFEMDNDISYFAAASRSALAKSTYEAGARALRSKMSPWKMSSDGVDEKVRESFAKLVNCSSDDVALCPSTSFALATAAKAIEPSIVPGDVGLILEEQMSSNTYPWQRLQATVGLELQAVPYPADGDWTTALLDYMYAVREEGKNLAFVAIPIYRWTDCSGPIDLGAIGEACHHPWGPGSDGRPAILIVDATQSLGAVPVDVQETPVDFLAASVHKWLLGAYGLSIMYVHPHWWENPHTMPLVEDEHCRLHMKNGDEEVPFDMALPGYPLATKRGARRLDSGGRPNPVLLPMALDGLRLVLRWGPANIADSLEALTLRIEMECRNYFKLWVPKRHGPHFIGVGPGPCDNCTTDEEVHNWVLEATAHLKRHRIIVTPKLKVMRVAPHVYTRDMDVDLFLQAMESFLQSYRDDF